MTNVLIGVGFMLGFFAVYFTIGVLFARSQAVRIYQRTYDRNRRMWTYTSEEKIREYAHREARSDLAIKVWFWPMEMLGALFSALGNGGTNLVMGPVYERQHRAEKLRRDAKTWGEVAEHPSSTAQEREMAKELERLLTQQAEEVDL